MMLHTAIPAAMRLRRLLLSAIRANGNPITA